MSQWAVMFPGQGSQSVGMGQLFFEQEETARRTFEEADDALGYALTQRIFAGPSEALKDTEVQQPAILTVSVAIWRVLKRWLPHFEPQVGLGLSLGEYSAYVAAGALEFPDAVRLTRIRGRAMQMAVPQGAGGMVAVLGLDGEQVESICREASQWGAVDPANFNAPGQIVISGLVEGLEVAETLIRQAGGKAMRLSVSAPFHSRLLQGAGKVLGEALGAVAFSSARFPVIANVDAELCQAPDAIIPRLVAQVSRPVRFEAGIRLALQGGATHFLELGPGRSLSNLVKKIDRGARVAAVENPEGLVKALELV